MNVSKAIGKDTDTYRHIKNPFICNSEFQVRLSGDKPRNLSMNTDYIMDAHNFLLFDYFLRDFLLICLT